MATTYWLVAKKNGVIKIWRTSTWEFVLTFPEQDEKVSV